jgi:chromosome segregation ATPase
MQPTRIPNAPLGSSARAASADQTHELPELAPLPEQSAPDKRQPASSVIDPEKIRETMTRLAQERAELQQRVSADELLIEELRTGIANEHEARLQLEEKLKDVMSAGIETARSEMSASPKDKALAKQVQKLESQLREKTAELERIQLNLAAFKLSGAPENNGEGGDLQRRVEDSETELVEAERRVRESVSSLARATSELEKERSERRRLEERTNTLGAQVEAMHENFRHHLETERTNQEKTNQLENQLRDAEASVTQLRANLQKANTDLHLAEEQLKTTAEMSKQLQESLQLSEKAKQAFQRTEQQLTSRLEADSKALSESLANLQKEASERQQLAATVETLQRQLKETTEKNALELSRLQSALHMEQLERKQHEGNAIQSRFASIESARADRVLLNRLRARVRNPMEELLRSTRRLLEVELQDGQKKLVESVLEQALLLKSNFQEAPAEQTADQQPLAA